MPAPPQPSGCRPLLHLAAAGSTAAVLGLLGLLVSDCWKTGPQSTQPWDAADDSRARGELQQWVTRKRRLGQPSCQASQLEEAPCNGGSCSRLMPNPMPCVWKVWSQWTPCNCKGTRKRHRMIKRAGDAGGTPCEGPGEEAQPCRADACSSNRTMDCLLGSWEPWSDCSKSCQGGQQYKTREIIRQQSGFGAFCSNSLHETRVCNSHPCPGQGAVDCKWSLWTSWSDCSATCGNGQKRRSRDVQVSPENEGQLCEPLTSEEVARCGRPCSGKAKDCLWSAWADWSTCSRSCGEGQTFRARRMAQEAQAGGTACQGYFEDYRSCTVASCSAGGKDCVFASWSDWSACSAPCNGQHSRNREVASASQPGGRPCNGAAVAIAPCNIDTESCGSQQVDCKYSTWDMWTGCSRSCGGGMTQHKRGIAVHAKGSGLPCTGDLETVKDCNTVACPGLVSVDCKWSYWSTWSACTVSCGGGQHRRHRTVILEATSGGKACDAGDSIQVGSCKSQACLVQKFVCDWASWGPWSHCERGGMYVSCGGGQRKRTRTTRLVKRYVPFDMSKQAAELDGGRLLQAPAGSSPSDPYGMDAGQDKHGARNSVYQCKEVQDVLEPCAQSKCAKVEPVDCTWRLWSEWSSCPCNGMRERHRVIASYALGGGKPCEGSEVVTKPCKANCNQAAPLDCVYSTWSAWTACPLSCGGGSSERYRAVVQYSRGAGKQCIKGGDKQRQPCNSFPCPKRQDCRWDDWSAYSACSATCGGGQMSHIRTVKQIAKHGGQPCEKKDSIIVIPCSTQACPTNARDCQFSVWNDWLGCSQTCGIGTQHRIRVVMVDASEDGKACLGKMQNFRECNMGRCQPKPKLDCMWAVWAPWSACTALCNGHRERSRAIQQFAEHGGAACEGSERAVSACNLKSPVCKATNPQDCVLDDWQAWTSCSRHCEGGQHYRSRDVLVPAKNFGKPCAAVLQQVEGCNSIPCPGNDRVDCRWDSWHQWSACTASCSGGQKMRQRGIAVESRRGGLPCSAQASIELMPCHSGSCIDALNACGWGEWNGWEGCSQTCGGGQQQRNRLRQWLPPGIIGSNSGNHASFGPRGVTPPQRRLVAAPVLGGPDDCTGSQREIRPCGIGPCSLSGPQALPCQWGAWSNWGSCTCEGFRERGRHVAIRAQNDGLVCVGPLRVTRACVPHCGEHSQDCTFGTWTEWSDCSASCDGGQKYHSRVLRGHAVRYGNGCRGRLEEVQACNTMQCSAPRDCKFGLWDSWSMCSRSCDGGQKSRSRDVAQFSTGGKACDNGALMEIIGCGAEPCSPWSPSDCSWTNWDNWGHCSKSCGRGQQSRTRTIASLATNKGRSCKGRYQDYRVCNLTPCQKPSGDCTFMKWSDWSKCLDTCGGNKERTRQIATFSAGGGGKPCQGPLRQTAACAAASSAACSGRVPNADCVLADWSEWSACTKPCGGGQHFKHCRISQQPRGSGEPCDTSLKVTAACHTQACPGTGVVDCAWADWGPFSACSATCGTAEMRRHRSIGMEASNGGKPCDDGATLELQSCSQQPCDSMADCTWSQWSPWFECSATCGPGQKRRRRDLGQGLQISGLAMAISGKIAPHPDDFFTAFTLRHETAVTVSAILGVVSLLLCIGHLLTSCTLGARQRRWCKWWGSRSTTVYALLPTEEVDESIPMEG